MAGFGGRTRTSGQGRPKGARNKRTVETEARIAQAAEAAAKALPEAFQGDAHALLMLVYKNETLDLSLRLDAAKAAIRYERPALASVDARSVVDVSTTVAPPMVVDPRSLTLEQRTALRGILRAVRAAEPVAA